MAFIPTPDEFPTWQEWARHVVEVLSDSVGTDTAAPVVSGTPPITKILRAAAATYSLTGRDVQFLLGPFHYTMQGNKGAYALSGSDAALLFENVDELVADVGSYTLTGQDATLTVDSSNLPTEGEAVTTFHSIGLYWQPPSAPLNDAVKIRYRPQGTSTWRNGHDLWYDDRAVHGRPVEARGSIVHCQPGTTYEIQFGMPQGDGSTQWVATLTTSTWSETFPVGTSEPTWSGLKTTSTSSLHPPPFSSTSRAHILHMDRSGTASGYTLYDFTGKNAIARQTNAGERYCVVISADFVILRGLKCEGGIASVFIEPGRHDIVIEDCEFTDFSADNTSNFVIQGVSYDRAVDENAAIWLQPYDNKYGTAGTKRVIIQRCKIHNPKFGTSPWDYGHPLGVGGILMYPSGGNHVIRYNEFFSTLDGTKDGEPDIGHYLYDAILGGRNFDDIGSPGPDTDVYLNHVSQCMDDAFEAEGGGMNVRVWKNYMDYVGTGVASTTCALGPLYIWRNVQNRTRFRYNETWGDEADRAGMFKSADRSDIGFGGGKRYVYHNTSLNHPPPAGEGPNGLGPNNGLYGLGTSQPLRNSTSRNNLWMLWERSQGAIDDDVQNVGNDCDYDMTNELMGFPEPNGHEGVNAVFKSGHGALAHGAGKYQLMPGTTGHDDGVAIPNFNDDVPAPHKYLGVAPDIGAHEEGSADIVYGVNATGS